ncbi:hypothetical protein E2C01_061612 [Portunus trituberculatus]|uniref:Uncharacterized protein n=1 Tax=Portunus trituberculatus TaxID=210409 RepID=A0A5B7HDP6_PORTR|nr:hypothetical protein [Portunus trituberculatus]
MVQGHGLLGRPRAVARGLKGPMVSPPHRHTHPLDLPAMLRRP